MWVVEKDFDLGEISLLHHNPQNIWNYWTVVEGLEVGFLWTLSEVLLQILGKIKT